MLLGNLALCYPSFQALIRSAAANVARELPTTTSTTPVLASSQSTVQAPASQQIPQSPQLPQLPPAQNQAKKPNAGKTKSVSTIATTTSTPTPAVPAHEAVPVSAQVPRKTDNAQPQKRDKDVSEHQNKNSEPQ